MIASIIILSIILIIVAYIIGKKQPSNQEKIDNTRLFQEQQQLQQQNQKLKNENESVSNDVRDKKQQIKYIDKEYQTKKQFIDDIEHAAQETRRNADIAYQEKLKQLNYEYEITKEKRANEYAATVQNYEDQLQVYKNKLETIKSTYAAAVEVEQRSAQVKAQLDDYRLNISDQDKNDIVLLERIKPQLSKPRILSMLIWQTYFQPIAKKKFPLIIGDKKICGIYKITNILDQKIYIGQSKDVKNRWNEHCKFGLSIDTPPGNKLYAAMKQDGLENFTFELLEECAADELNEKEAFYIDMFNSKEYGYNSVNGVK